MKRCERCGAQIPKDARYCVHCMTPLQYKTEIRPLKIFGRWQRYSVIALLLCAVLAAATLVLCFSGAEPGQDDPSEVFGTDTERTENTEDFGTESENQSTDLESEGGISTHGTDSATDSKSETETDAPTSDPLSDTVTTNTDSENSSDLVSGSSDQTDEITETVAPNPLFASGRGTPSDPYLIATAEQLNNVRYHLADCFRLKNDIEFSASDFEEGGPFHNGGAGWLPLGETDEKPFSGTFDGNGFSVKNLYLNRVFSAKGRAGLFGSLSGTVQNLKVENGDFSVSRSNVNGNALHLGGICGRVLKGAAVRDCSFTGQLNGCHTTGGIAGASLGTVAFCRNGGTVFASGASAGGIVGYQFEGTVSSCRNEGSVNMESATAGAGGIVGGKVGGTATNCCNAGTVELQQGHAGGIIGSSFGAAVNADNITENCYNIGSVTGSAGASAGGIAGGLSSGIIQFCYNAGAVTSDSVAGGIVGGNYDGMIEFCYYLDSVSLGSGNGTDCGTKCTAEQLRKQSTFAEFDFDTVWMMGSGSGSYPTLRTLQPKQ